MIQDKGLPLNLETPTVFGLVTRTNTAAKMIEINLGSDDGLKKGITMEVYRFGDNLATTTYLGQIRLSEVAKTSAVGQVISLKGTIQKDDHVATRIDSPNAPQGIPGEKPKSDIYTVMLLIALLAVGAAIALLCSEMSKYEWDYKAQTIQRPAAIPGR